MAYADFQRQYAEALADLTFNSKPIIHALTMLAGEHQQHAAAVVSVVAHRIESAPHGMKLPALYLLDSIVKNIGEPFRGLFAERIVPLFLGVYDGAGASERQSLVKLLATWKSVFQEHFGPLEAAVLKRHAPRRPTPAPAPAPVHAPVHAHAPAPPPARTQGHGHHAPPPQYNGAYANGTSGYGSGYPRDPSAPPAHNDRYGGHPPPYGGAPPAAVYGEAPRTGYPRQQHSGPPPGHGPPPSYYDRHPPYAQPYPHHPRPHAQPHTQPHPQPHAYPHQHGAPQHAYPAGGYPYTEHPQDYRQGPPPAAASRYPAPAAPHNPAHPTSRPPPSRPPHSDAPSSRPAASRKPSKKKGFTADALKEPDPDVIAALYTNFSLQCPNCALRFHERENMNEHMDWHFKMNKRENEKKSTSRGWYLEEDVRGRADCATMLNVFLVLELKRNDCRNGLMCEKEKKGDAGKKKKKRQGKSC
eukprot:TRINITY_DN6376_c0_g1_i2.p1 TRINITY_DN6376_c0_g1~~TRINITY_DN6376_c0_g1_i2.p1  ORF type:complete len:471 (+),score=37.49 TRINITY_DN6376_c0_g1_i2:386-1798(+)